MDIIVNFKRKYLTFMFSKFNYIQNSFNAGFNLLRDIVGLQYFFISINLHKYSLWIRIELKK